MTEPPEAAFAARIREALARYPDAFPADDPDAGPPRELVAGDADDLAPRRTWGPQSSPPPDYPDDIPFIPNARTLAIRRDGPPDITLVIWFELTDSGRVLDAVLAACVAAGWDLKDGAPRQAAAIEVGQLLARVDETRYVWAHHVRDRHAVCLIQVSRAARGPVTSHESSA